MYISFNQSESSKKKEKKELCKQVCFRGVAFFSPLVYFFFLTYFLTWMNDLKKKRRGKQFI